jgi:hypothetical protein
VSCTAKYLMATFYPVRPSDGNGSVARCRVVGSSDRDLTILSKNSFAARVKSFTGSLIPCPNDDRGSRADLRGRCLRRVGCIAR